MASENEKKLEQEIKKLTQERIGLEKEILKLKESIVGQEKTSVSTIKELIKLDALRLDNVGKEEEVRKKIEKIEKDSEKRSKKTIDGTETVNDNTNELFDLTSKLSSLSVQLQHSQKSILEDQSTSSALMKAMGNDSEKVAQYTNDQNLAYTAIVNSMQNTERLQGGTSKQQEMYLASQVRSGDLASEMINYEDRLIKAKANAVNGIYESIDLTELELDLRVNEQKLIQEKDKMTAEQYKAAQETINLMKGRLADIEIENKALEQQAAQAGLIKDAFAGVTNTVSNVFNGLPSADKVGKLMGIDKTATNMKTKFKEAANAAFNEKDFGKAFAAAGGGLKSMIGLAGKFSAAMGIGLLIQGLSMVVDLFGEADKQVSEIQKEMGGTKEQAFATQGAAQKLASDMGLVGINTMQVVKGMSTVSDIYGGLDVASQIKSGNKALEQFAKDATVLSEKFGLSTEEIGNIKSLATLTGESMGSLVNKSQGMAKGLMTDKAAMKTLASVPKEVAVAFKGGSTALVAAAQKAKMLGMDLKKVQSIGDGMLDIESSLAKEMEARVITGKNLNLDAARQFALQGDIAGLQDELLHQAGSLSDFQSMNRLQQKSMAEAMGMSVEEMTEMLTKAQELKDAHLDSTKLEALQKKNAEDLRKEASMTTDAAAKAYIEKLAAEKESATLQEKMTSAMTKLKEQAMKIIAPLLEIATTLFDSLMAGDSLGNVMDIVGGAVKAIVPIIKTVFGVISSIIKPLTSILGFFFQTEEKVDATGNKVEGLKSGFMGVLGVVGAIGAAFAGKALLGKGMDMLKDKAAEAGGAIKDKILGSLGKVGEKAKDAGKKMAKMGGDKAGEVGGKMKKAKMPGKKDSGGGFLDSIVDAVNKVDAKKLLMAAAAILVLAAALYVTAKAVQEFVKTDWDAMAKAGVALLGLVGIAYLISKVKGAMIEGAAAMLILGAALYLIGAALKQFIDIKWEDLGKAAAALIGLIGVAALLGSFAPIFLMGAGVLAALGAALLVFSVAMLVLGKAAKDVTPLFETAFTGIGNLVTTIGEQIVNIISAIGDNVTKVVDKLMGISNLDPSKLAGIALGIGLISAAILAFGGGSALGGIADGLGKMFGGDSPIDQLINLTEKLDGEKLLALSTGIMSIAATMKIMADNLGNIDTGKLDEFKESLVSLLESMGSSALMEGIGKLLGGDSPLSQINNLLEKLSPEKLSASAKSLIEVSNSLKTLADTIAGLDIEKLGQVFEKMNQGSIASKASKVMDSIVGGISSMFGGGESEAKEGEKGVEKGTSTIKPTSNAGTPVLAGAVSTVQQTTTTANPAIAAGVGGGVGAATSGGDMSGVEKKLDQLISVLTTAVSQPTIIKFGDKIIDTIKTELNLKKAYTSNSDNSYGRRI